MGWQDAPIVDDTPAQKNWWESAPLVDAPAPAPAPAPAAAPAAAPRERHWYDLPGDQPQYAQGGIGAAPITHTPSQPELERMRQQDIVGAQGVAMGLGAPVMAGLEMVAPKTYQGIEAGYQQRRKELGATSMDVPRLLAEAPYLGLGGEVKAAGALPRMLKTGAQAAGVTALTPTQQTQGNVLGNKAGQLATGFTLGSLFAGAGEIARAFPKTAKAIAQAATEAKETTATNIVKGTEAAKEYVEKNLSVAWENLPDTLKNSLANIAQTSGKLDKLDPRAIERLATLRRAGIETGTVGQLTRDPAQQTKEMLAAQSEGGKALQDLYGEQNRQLVSSIEGLRGRPTATSPSSTETGRGVRQVLADKLSGAKRTVNRLYKIAEQAAGNETFKANELADYVNNHADPELVGYITRKLPKDAYQFENGALTLTRDLTLKEGEIVRKAATAAKKAGGDKGYYAGEVTDLLDKLTKDSGGAWYAKARQARAALGEQFERTKAVNDLIKTRGRSKEYAVDLENVWRQSVLRGSVEDLTKLQKSLTSGSPTLAKRGAQAFDDLRAATAQHLLDKATRSPKTSTGDLNAQWNGFRNAVNEIGPEKLKVLFGKQGAAKINDMVEALEIIKTEAPSNWRGSSTAKNLIHTLEVLGKVPGVGMAADVVTGGIRAVGQLAKAGQSGRVAAQALQEPVAAAEAAAARSASGAAASRRAARLGAGAAMTLQDVYGNQQP